MSSQEFEVPPPGKYAQMFPLIIGLILPMIMVALIAVTARQTSDWLVALPALLVLPIAAIFMAWRMHRRTIRLEDGALRYGLFPWQRAPVTAFDLDAASVVNLGEHRELQAVLRLAGTAMPGYRSGWFYLRNKRRAYVLLTDDKRVLMLPKHDGGLLLFSLVRPDALLDALRKSADDNHGTAR